MFFYLFEAPGWAWFKIIHSRGDKIKKILFVLTVLIVGMMLLSKATAQITIERGLSDPVSAEADLVIGGEGYVTFGAQLKGRAAPVGRTGQSTSHAIGDDGDLQSGAVWPGTRFVDNSDGTVTDHLTGLVWLRKADCFENKNWLTALFDCNNLANGENCGVIDGSYVLADGSIAGDWRLPSRLELESLLALGYYDPALSNSTGTDQWEEGNAFTGVQSNYYYWSSTTSKIDSSSAWYVHMGYGFVGYFNKDCQKLSVWPVRNDN